MIAACRKANVKLMIGYRVHYEPTHLEAQRILRSGDLGQIEAIEGAFGFDAKPDQWRLTRKYGGGGSLMDVGIYPLNETRWLLGEEPSAFTASVSTRDHTSGRFAEVEQTVVWTMKFPSGILGSYSCTYGSNMPSFLRVNGGQGSIELTSAYNYNGVHLSGSADGSRIDLASPGSDDTGHFQIEAEHFAQCIRTNTEPRTPGEEGLKDLLAIEAIYKAAGTPIA
jgi:predicted dehydrogenase